MYSVPSVLLAFQVAFSVYRITHPQNSKLPAERLADLKVFLVCFRGFFLLKTVHRRWMHGFFTFGN